MNVLMISLDKSLLKKESSVSRRHDLYTRELDGEIHVVLHTAHKGIQKVKQGNLVVNPSNSFFKPFFLYDACKIGREIIKKNDIDLIVTQDPHITGLIGVLLKKKSKIPLCVHFHADFLDNPYWIKENPINRVFNLISKYVITKANGFRVVSKKIKETLISKGINEEQVMHQSTPIDLDFFRNETHISKKEFRNKYNIAGKKVLLFVGRLTAQKNLPFLIDSFTSLNEKEVVLLLAGNGEEKEKLESQVKSLQNNNIQFLGRLNMNELRDAYYCSDALVLPSLYEGTAKVNKEAASCSLPMILTDISGTKDFLDDTCAKIIPVNDRKELQDSIREIIENREMSSAYSLNAKNSITELSEDEGIKRITQFWRGISKK